MRRPIGGISNRKFLPRPFHFHASTKFNRRGRGKRVGRIITTMEKNEEKEKKKVIRVLPTNELKTALDAEMFIIQVRFDNNYEPVFLASKENLSYIDCIAYVNEMGLFADKDYRLICWEKKEITK